MRRRARSPPGPPRTESSGNRARPHAIRPAFRTDAFRKSGFPECACPRRFGKPREINRLSLIEQLASTLQGKRPRPPRPHYYSKETFDDPPRPPPSDSLRPSLVAARQPRGRMAFP
ncbi:hypothetical protein DO70_4355 [Burkholderia pseudomallei]|nr:hypothetical protein DO70_4355 [Burkholderia pseudomallei]